MWSHREREAAKVPMDHSQTFHAGTGVPATASKESSRATDCVRSKGSAHTHRLTVPMESVASLLPAAQLQVCGASLIAAARLMLPLSCHSHAETPTASS